MAVELSFIRTHVSAFNGMEQCRLNDQRYILSSVQKLSPMCRELALMAKFPIFYSSSYALGSLSHREHGELTAKGVDHEMYPPKTGSTVNITFNGDLMEKRRRWGCYSTHPPAES